MHFQTVTNIAVHQSNSHSSHVNVLLEQTNLLLELTSFLTRMDVHVKGILRLSSSLCVACWDTTNNLRSRIHNEIRSSNGFSIHFSSFFSHASLGKWASGEQVLK